MTDAVETRFLALETELSRLRLRVGVLEAAETQRQRARLKRGELRTLQTWLPAVVGALGSEEFLARELAETNDVGLRLVVGDRSARSVGRLLARAEGIDIGGFVVVSSGVEVNVRRWSVRKAL